MISSCSVAWSLPVLSYDRKDFNGGTCAIDVCQWCFQPKLAESKTDQTKPTSKSQPPLFNQKSAQTLLMWMYLTSCAGGPRRWPNEWWTSWDVWTFPLDGQAGHCYTVPGLSLVKRSCWTNRQIRRRDGFICLLNLFFDLSFICIGYMWMSI